MQSTIPHQHSNSTQNDLDNSKAALGLPPGETSNANAPQTNDGFGQKSVFKLTRNLVDETKTLVRQELTLAKKEIAEKLAYAGRHVAGLGAGVGITYAGAIILLIGLGFLIAWAIHFAGIEGLFAAFLGLAGVGLVSISLGASLVLKGVSALKSQSLAPERTLYTLQELKGGPIIEKPKPAPAPEMPEPSSAEMQSRVEATEDHIGETLEALRDRLSPRNIKLRIEHRIQNHPYRNGLVAMLAGLAGGFAVRRRFRRA
jgi:membrane protein